MRHVGQTLHAAGVSAIYLIHGTFAGTDALGLIRGIGRLAPAARTPLERQAKRLTDAVIGDAGNYAARYADLFEESISTGNDSGLRIPVRLFHWTSENHHIGRADAAVRLIDELHAFAEAGTRPGRVLIWGHSHAGNVMALVSNLLAAHADVQDAFFDAAKSFYQTPLVGRVDVPVWQRVRDVLRQPQRALDRVALDMVTFGTPVRYGWDPDGYARLLHFVNHRPAEGLPPYRVPFPPKLQDLLRATHGDYIQQMAVAGTNVAPSFFAWRTWLADRRLGRLLQSGVRRRDLLRNLSCGQRVPGEGTTLLVDYGDSGDGLPDHVAGHAAYTRCEWLLFHAEEVCRRFYLLVRS